MEKQSFKTHQILNIQIFFKFTATILSKLSSLKLHNTENTEITILTSISNLIKRKVLRASDLWEVTIRIVVLQNKKTSKNTKNWDPYEEQ